MKTCNNCRHLKENAFSERCLKCWQEHGKQQWEENVGLINEFDQTLYDHLTKDSNVYVRLKDVVEHFTKVDAAYSHSPWNISQILSNLGDIHQYIFKEDL